MEQRVSLLSIGRPGASFSRRLLKALVLKKLAVWLPYVILLTSTGWHTVVCAQWDGFGALFALASELGVALETPATINLSELKAEDALLVVGPRHALPTASLTAFLRAGGRLALLDDSGTGDRLLSAYQVKRVHPPRDGAPALRGDPNLLIAYPSSAHPLVAGVPLLLTNQAAALQHPALKPVFTFGRSHHAFMLAGAIGMGRLVATGDASTVINQLMTVPAHRRFARNLLEYLSKPNGRILFAGPETRIYGDFGGQHAAQRSRVDNWLRRVAHPDLPPMLVTMLSLLSCCIAGALVLGAFPRRSPYLKPDLFPKAKVESELEGRTGPGTLHHEAKAIAAYVAEVDALLGERLGLQPDFDDGALERALAAGGMDAPKVQAMMTGRSELRRWATEAQRQCDATLLVIVVRRGEALLEESGMIHR